MQPRYLSTSSSLLAAQVQKPAPAFKAQAVVDGQFKEVSLEDYKVSSECEIYMLVPLLIFSGKVCGGVFLSSGFHLRLPHGNHRFLREDRGVQEDQL